VLGKLKVSLQKIYENVHISNAVALFNFLFEWERWKVLEIYEKSNTWLWKHSLTILFKWAFLSVFHIFFRVNSGNAICALRCLWFQKLIFPHILFFFLVDFVVPWWTRRSWRRWHSTRTKLTKPVTGFGWKPSSDTSKCGPSALSSYPRSSSTFFSSIFEHTCQISIEGVQRPSSNSEVKTLYLTERAKRVNAPIRNVFFRRMSVSMHVSFGLEVFKWFWWNLAHVFLDFKFRFCREIFFDRGK